MPNVSENMSKLEREAQELVMKLRELHEQIGSYKEAKESLQKTSRRLESLIETTKNLAKASHAVISKFNEISGAGFIEQVKEVNKNIEQINVGLDETNRKNQFMLLMVMGGIAIIVILQLVKMFLIN